MSSDNSNSSDNHNNNNGKPTYAQVAASPPLHDDENETKSATSSVEENAHQKVVTAVGGSHFSKPKKNQKEVVTEVDKTKGDSDPKSTGGSISSVGSSEPEIIIVEPPIPPPVDKTPKQPEPTPKPSKEKQPSIEIEDNVKDDFAPLKHTSMLTKSNGNEREAQSDDEFEVVSDETEKQRRFWNRVAVVSGAVALAVLVGFGVWKLTRKPPTRSLF